MLVPLPGPLRVLGSLKWRITLGTLAVVVLSLFAVTSELLRRAQADMLVAQRDHELTTVAAVAHQLGRRVGELQRVLELTALQVDPGGLADDARARQFLHAKPVARYHFSSLFLADRAGTVLALADDQGIRRPELHIGDRAYFQQTVSGDRPVVSEPVPGRVSNAPVLVFTYPVRSAQGVVGVIGGTLRLASGALLPDAPELTRGPGAEVLWTISDSAGRTLVHPRVERLMQPMSTEPRLARAWAHWLRLGSPLETAGLQLEQPQELVSAAAVAGTGWMVWRARAEGALLQPLVDARRHALWLAALAALAGSVVTGFVVIRMFRPLARLEQRALHLLDDDREADQGWPEARGEIGHLARVLRQVSTERARLAQHNEQNLRRLRSVMAAAPVGIAFTHQRRFVLVSQEMCQMFGRDEADLLGQSTDVIYARAEDFDAVGPLVVLAFKAGRPYSGEWLLRRADGSTFWAQLRGRPVDAADPGAGVIWSIIDINAEVAQRSQLEWSATHDALTGLANRQAFDARLEQLFHARDAALPATLVAIDLDRFKPINDDAGHAAGDAVLKAVAAAITACVRVNDLAVRTGGDEFAVLLEHCPHDVGLRVAEGILRRIAALQVPWEGRTLGVGASLGVAPLAPDMPDAATWTAAADAACYAAKAAGRGTIRSAAPPPAAETRSALRLVPTPGARRN